MPGTKFPASPANEKNLFRQYQIRHQGARIKEGEGSRLAVELNGVRAYFHRPHPQKETDKGALVSVRRFLENAGVKPC